jgi:hypothetical protein
MVNPSDISLRELTPNFISARQADDLTIVKSINRCGQKSIKLIDLLSG